MSIHLLRGSTWKLIVLEKQKFLLISPHKTQKAYFNQKFIKNNISYAIFEGEKSESD